MQLVSITGMRKLKSLTASFGMNVSRANFTRQDLKTDSMAKYNFTNFYPQARLEINLGQSGTLSFNYRGNTRAPSVSQIQPLRDNTDPLNIRIGNPDLKQAFQNNVELQFNTFKILAERGIMAGLSFSNVQNDFSEFNSVDSFGRRIYQLDKR